MICVTLDEWKRKLDFPTGETVILHNPKVRWDNKTLIGRKNRDLGHLS